MDKQYCVVSVTGMSSPEIPCHFQNFSDRYVSIGVLNKKNSCCGFGLPFIDPTLVLEGSSFATPVISGQLGLKILRTGPHRYAAEYIQTLAPVKIASGFHTWDGQYIVY